MAETKKVTKKEAKVVKDSPKGEEEELFPPKIGVWHTNRAPAIRRLLSKVVKTPSGKRYELQKDLLEEEWDEVILQNRVIINGIALKGRQYLPKTIRDHALRMLDHQIQQEFRLRLGGKTPQEFIGTFRG